MRRTAVVLGLGLAIGLAVGLIGDRVLIAQPAPVRVSELLRTDLVGMEGKELIVQRMEAGPGAGTGRHLHPGHEVAYILEGAGVLEIEGRLPSSQKAGEVAYIPARTVHEGRNPSPTAPLTLLVIRIHEKGQPVTIKAQ